MGNIQVFVYLLAYSTLNSNSTLLKFITFFIQAKMFLLNQTCYFGSIFNVYISPFSIIQVLYMFLVTSYFLHFSASFLGDDHHFMPRQPKYLLNYSFQNLLYVYLQISLYIISAYILGKKCHSIVSYVFNDSLFPKENNRNILILCLILYLSLNDLI